MSDLRVKLSKLNKKKFCREIEEICKKYENVSSDASLISVVDGLMIKADNISSKELKNIYFGNDQHSSSNSRSDDSSTNFFNLSPLSEKNQLEHPETFSSEESFSVFSDATFHDNSLTRCKIRPRLFEQKSAKDFDSISVVSLSHFQGVEKVAKAMNQTDMLETDGSSSSKSYSTSSESFFLRDSLKLSPNLSVTCSNCEDSTASSNEILALNPNKKCMEKTHKTFSFEAPSLQSSTQTNSESDDIYVPQNNDSQPWKSQFDFDSPKSKLITDKSNGCLSYSKGGKSFSKRKASSRFESIDFKYIPLMNKAPLGGVSPHKDDFSKSNNKENFPSSVPHSPSSLLCSPVRSISLLEKPRPKRTQKKLTSQRFNCSHQGLSGLEKRVEPNLPREMNASKSNPPFSLSTARTQPRARLFVTSSPIHPRSLSLCKTDTLKRVKPAAKPVLSLSSNSIRESSSDLTTSYRRSYRLREKVNDFLDFLEGSP